MGIIMGMMALSAVGSVEIAPWLGAKPTFAQQDGDSPSASEDQYGEDASSPSPPPGSEDRTPPGSQESTSQSLSANNSRTQRCNELCFASKGHVGADVGKSYSFYSQSWLDQFECEEKCEDVDYACPLLDSNPLPKRAPKIVDPPKRAPKIVDPPSGGPQRARMAVAVPQDQLTCSQRFSVCTDQCSSAEGLFGTAQCTAQCEWEYALCQSGALPW